MKDFLGSIVIPLSKGVSAKLRTKHMQSDDGVEPPSGDGSFSTTAEPTRGFVGLGVSSVKMCACKGM